MFDDPVSPQLRGRPFLERLVALPGEWTDHPRTMGTVVAHTRRH